MYNIHQPNAVVEMGIPLTPASRVSGGALLAGRIAEAFTDVELRALLARGVPMDSCALEVLWSRGLGEFTGVRPGKKVLGGAVETLTAHVLNGRFPGDSRDALLESADNVRALELVQPGAVELARLTGYDGFDARQGRTVPTACARDGAESRARHARRGAVAGGIAG